MPVNLDDYEPVSKDGTALAEGLMRIWDKLGRPDDCSVASGWIMVDQIVNAWTKFFRTEAEDWMHDRKIDLQNEMTLKQISKKGGGYNPITYPPTLYHLLSTMLPKQKLNDKKFIKALAQRHGMFKTTNLGL